MTARNKEYKKVHKELSKLSFETEIILSQHYLTVEYEGGPEFWKDKDILRCIEKLGYETNGSGWCGSSNVRDIGFTKMEEEE